MHAESALARISNIDMIKLFLKFLFLNYKSAASEINIIFFRVTRAHADAVSNILFRAVDFNKIPRFSKIDEP